MKRRDFLRSAGVISAGIAFPGATRLFAEDPAPAGWRTFELTTRVEILKPSGITRVWLPAGLITETPFQRTLSNSYHAEGGVSRMTGSKADALGIVVAEFPAGVKPMLTLTSRIATRNIAVDVAAAGKVPPASAADLQHFLRPTHLLADRWNREVHSCRDHQGRAHGPRKSASHLRMDRGQHVSRSENAGMRPRGHSFHA